MDAPENYYAVLGVSANADSDTIKRAYRQLARRFHPDLAGPEGAIQMKRINRAYAVLSDTEKRQQYDVILGGVIDMRRQGFVRPQPRSYARENPEDVEFSGLNTFSTRGPLHAGPVIHTSHGVTSSLHSTSTVQGILIATGSIEGKGEIWQVAHGQVQKVISFANESKELSESLRELRLSSAGSLVTGWNRLGIHVWDAHSGAHLWSMSLIDRAVAAHYSLDASLHVLPDGRRVARLALPHKPAQTRDIPTPRAWGVRATDVVSHDLKTAPDKMIPNKIYNLRVCVEEALENRSFWAIRMRALSHDSRTLVTLSCGQVQGEAQQMAIVRRWNLTTKGFLGNEKPPQLGTSILMGRCEDCTPPYAITPDATLIAFVYGGKSIRLADTTSGTYSEFASGTMGSSSRMALSPDGQWLAVAREDSEDSEGVIDLWSIATGQIAQKFYHPWQISALHFDQKHMIVALTDGTIQLWQP
jgi:WD40 repeat protein